MGRNFSVEYGIFRNWLFIRKRRVPYLLRIIHQEDPKPLPRSAEIQLLSYFHLTLEERQYHRFAQPQFLIKLIYQKNEIELNSSPCWTWLRIMFYSPTGMSTKSTANKTESTQNWTIGTAFSSSSQNGWRWRQ